LVPVGPDDRRVYSRALAAPGTDTDDIELVMVTDGSPDVASRSRCIEPIRGWSPSISRATSATARR
ncbi:MAG: hypothetical protein QOI87_1920, partial [Bradyrhizobium sp.]|nr:hypothetical protein [Bradyrhizobium sp.]